MEVMMSNSINAAGPAGLQRSQEVRAATASGYVMLLFWLVMLAICGWCVLMLIGDKGAAGGWIVLAVLSALAGTLVACGFYLINPNEAAAIQLFGTYKGTDRETGLRWVLPWLTRKKIPVRANNLISDKIKVNDLRGNPIEMAAQVVWRVTDTAQALFDVEDYKAFVMVQIEAAVRTIGSRYPYDDFTHQEVTLRGNHDQVGAELRTELIARLSVAGITVDECGFTHLAYATEIAGAMLRRQQAEAVVAARKTLVEGAVGMVEMALAMLSEKNVVELDDERRAAMVSNLMVVLCGERDTQPVVNAGSLY
jgi:regulator of protease activity HflC (stomatin/prohibitin superfamily)